MNPRLLIPTLRISLSLLVLLGLACGQEAQQPQTAKSAPGGLDLRIYSTEQDGIPEVHRRIPTLELGKGTPHVQDPGIRGPLGARFVGSFQPRFTEEYTLTVKYTGGARLWVDGQLLINQWTRDGDASATFKAEAGKSYPLVVEYRTHGKPPFVQLLWQSPSEPLAVIPADRLLPKTLQAPELPESTAVSPVFIEGSNRSDVPTHVLVDGREVALQSDSDSHYWTDLPLNSEGAITVEVKGSGTAKQKAIAWKTTAINQEAGPLTLRVGDSLLLVSPHAGTLTVKKDGAPYGQPKALQAQARLPFRFSAPGSYELAVPSQKAEAVSTLRVTAVAADTTKHALAQVNARRPVRVKLMPANATVAVSASDSVSVDALERSPEGIVASAIALKPGFQRLAIRLGGPEGPILATQPVDAFALEIPARRRVLVNADTHRGQSTLTLHPWVPDLAFKLSSAMGHGTFREGQKSLLVTTSGSLKDAGAMTFDRIPSGPRGETIGGLTYEIMVPPCEWDFCFDIEGYEVLSTGVRGEDIPTDDCPWDDPNVCHVECFKSLIFTHADDPRENEKYPELGGYTPKVSGCLSTKPPPGTNSEVWISRQWPLMTRELGGAGGHMEEGAGTQDGYMYRLVVSGPPPFKGRLDNPIPALFGGKYMVSECKPCKGDCGPVAPDMDTGTIPGRYTTTVQACSDSLQTLSTTGRPSSEAPPKTVERGTGSTADGGEFFVSKLDAHGLGGDTTAKFPDYAEVLPKKAGWVNAPVIQMDSGGDKSVQGCSLYGTVCSPSENTWQLTAIAKDPKTGENIPPGYTIKWSGIPYTVVDSKNGQPLTIQATLPAGRWIPILQVFGADPLTGKTSGLLGKAEIHSIAVEERPTCNVGPKNPDVPANVLKGAAFNVTNSMGGADVPVDARLGISGSPHPHPGFAIRGRVSLDGYPQNEYWVTGQDTGDLPQVVTVPANQPQTYYLQGYQVASLSKDDLLLRVEGQAQLEACNSGLFFRDCTPCGVPPPTRYPVVVSWQETDTEPFNSSYPLLFQDDEPDLKYDGSSPAVAEVQADNVADDYEGLGTDLGYYVNNGLRGRVNFLAHIDWDFLAIDTGYFIDVPDDQKLKLDWNWGPMAGNYCDTPTLRDLERAGSKPDSSGQLTAVFQALRSRVQLDFTKPRGKDVLAKAGDRFCMAPHSQFANSNLGPSFWRRREVLIEPGDKIFHIVIPNHPTDAAQKAAISAFDPNAMFDLSDDEFANSIYKDWKWAPPINSEESDLLSLYTFDRFRNPLPEGRTLTWHLEGGGRLGSYKPLVQDNPEEPLPDQLAGLTKASGKATVVFTQDKYPTCPWQFVGRHDQSVIHLELDGMHDTATYSIVTTAEPLPAPIPELVLFADYQGAEKLDIAKGDSGIVTVQAMRGGLPVPGVNISFTSTNGALAGGGGLVPTNAQGIASVTLTSQGARLTKDGYGDILVTGSVDDLRVMVRTDGPPTNTIHAPTTVARGSSPRWVSSAPLTLRVDHPVLASDAAADGFVDVETLDDTGELNAPQLAGSGAVLGDGLLRVPYYASSTVYVTGPPNHDVSIAIVQPSLQAIQARYPFDTLVNGKTPEALGGPAADVAGGVTISPEHMEGTGAAHLDGSGTITVPSSTAIDPTGGLEISCWVRPDQLGPAEIISRQGQYRLEILPSERLQLTVTARPGAPATLVSQNALPIGRWSFVMVRFAAQMAKISFGPDADHLDSVATGYGQAIFPAAATPAVVGSKLIGLLDNLTFVKGGLDPQGVTAVGLTPGATITTNAAGKAQFVISVTPSAPLDYRPQLFVVEVFGSEQAQVTVQTVPRSIWGDMVAIGKAFMMGEESLGSDAAWYERASAWASSYLPVLSDLRTLSFEIYKAATGCDSVSWMNITFATVGLVVDICTFGTCGAAVKASETVLKVTFKAILKKTATNAAIDLSCRGAITAFCHLATVEVMQTDGSKKTLPAPWVLASKAYLDQVKTWFETDVLRPFAVEAFRSADDLFIGLKAFNIYQNQAIEDLFQFANEIQTDFHIVRGEPAERMYLWGVLPPFRGPPGSIFSTIGFMPGPIPPVKTMVNRSRLLRAVFKLMGESEVITRIRGDADALRGAQKIALMVAKDARNGEDLKLLARRVAQALGYFSPDHAQALMKDFNQLYKDVKALNDATLLKKVQDLARDFAARGEQAQALRARTKGATYAIQEATEAVHAGRIRGPTGIEPPAAHDNRLFRDLMEEIGGVQKYIELKAVANIGAKEKAIASQVSKHFRRVVKLTSINELPKLVPFILRSTEDMPEAAQRTIKGHAIASILNYNGFSSPAEVQAVTTWVEKNVTFETKALRYVPTK